jgi:Ca2+-binding RTX toxin-like protein
MWKYPQSQTFTNGETIELSAGDNIWVSQYVFLANEATDTISAYTANHTVLIDGAVASKGTAISMRGYFSTGNVVSISETGIVRGSIGVYQGGINSETINDGQIIGSNDGVALLGLSTSSVSHVENSGSISGGYYGVINESDFDTVQTVFLENSGTIIGGIESFAGANGSESVVNTGKMIGKINFGSELDFYDGSKGYINGIIDGGADADTIFCGNEANTVFGGTGSDSIYGGGGADELTGGADIDIFLFDSVKNSTVSAKGQDTITDFTHGEDLLEIQSVDFNSNTKGLQNPTIIGSKQFSHTAGELRYDHTTTDTYIYADIDGNAKADFEIHLDGIVKLSVKDFFF